MEQTNKHTQSRLYSIVAGFSIGACAGLVLGGVTLSSVPLQGILLRNITVLQDHAVSSVPTKVTPKPATRVSAVTQRLLRRAARLRAQKRLVVTADTDEPVVLKPILKPVLSGASSTFSSAAEQTLHAAAEGESSMSPIIQSSSSSVTQVRSDFPAFDHTSFPVAKVPNWGAMHSPAVWNRTYKEMTADDFVAIPKYDMTVLTTPMSTLTNDLTPAHEAMITAKLFYSTRFLGSYDIDTGEYTGDHSGVDLKLPLGTPIGAIAGGRVASVTTTPELGLHVIIEHRLNNGTTVYSIYGHFGQAAVKAGDDITPGQYIGNVGMTGNTSGPHLHLQIDKGIAGEAHIAYMPARGTARSEEEANLINPMTFIGEHRND